MTHAADLPAWAALPTALLLLLGAGLTLTGSLGLLRLGSFYDRIHAPTLGTTLGIGCVLVASMVFFSALQTRPVLHEVLIAALMVVTTPVTLMLLARAALYRDRREGSDEVPPPSPPPAGHRLHSRQGRREPDGDHQAEHDLLLKSPGAGRRGPCR